VNNVFATHGVNIEGQLLGTRGELGYVVTDVAAGMTEDAIAELRAMPSTVRLRTIS
jgi:D-3-phosphoglycerate dehydrogenase